MHNNIELNLVKMALSKNNDIDLLKITGNRKCFEYVCESEFQCIKNILIIGAANINNILKIVEFADLNSQIVILESDEEVYRVLLEELELLKKETNKSNWKLIKCYWDNLKLDQDLLENFLRDSFIEKIADYNKLIKHIEKQCRDKPLLSEGWADVVYISSINRFNNELANKILEQTFTFVKNNGKVLMDIVLSDEKLTKHVQSCYSGIEYNYVPKEEEVLDLLLKNAFHGIKYAWRAEFPIKIVDRVELRPFLIKAYKGKQGICLEKGHAVFYGGPWKEVVDDDGHKLIRGQRVAVCEKTFNVLTSEPYNNEVIGIQPYFVIDDSEANLFDCSVRPIRDPKITKGIKTVDSEKYESISKSNKCC